MVTYDGDSNQPEAPRRSLISRYLFSTAHKVIGLEYLWLALFSVFLGMAMSLVMRIHLVWPGAHIPFLSVLDAPERYATLPLLHGSLMVFFVLTAAPQLGFGNYLLPLQIGAREMAFPILNLCSFWASVVSLFGMTAAFLAAPQSGITIWIASVSIFLAAALCSAINFSVTAIDLRAKGMTLPRLPLTVWAWLVNAILGMLIFSVLLAACAGLLSDRLFGTHFFSATSFLASQPANVAADPWLVLWQRLFWFFAQAEVYIAMLPCFGIVSHLIATFSRKPVWKERLVVLALCAVGLVGFCVWGQHMFSSGLNPFSPLVFSILAASLGLPAAILLVSWIGTLWKACIQLNTSLLFALGFVSLFLSGGLSGIFLARRELTSRAGNEDFVAGHFHLVMGVAATFAVLAALFFWFPKLFGRRLNESLGKTHFWLTFAGVYCVFMPMHWLGLVSLSAINPGADLSSIAAWIAPARSFITAGILITVFAQGIFLVNFLWSLLRGERVQESNPWRATTLEWRRASIQPTDNSRDQELAIYRGAYEFGVPGLTDDFIPSTLPRIAWPRQTRESGEASRKINMPGTIAPPDIELIIEDSRGGGGGGGRPPDGGDNGDDNDYDKRRRRQPGSPRRFSTGIAIAMVSILMFFMALASAFLVLHHSSHVWVAVRLPWTLWLNTAVLIGSSFMLEKARARLSLGDDRGFRKWWLVTTVMGFLFVAGQLVAWRQLAAQGVYIASNQASSFFYIFTGAHGVHLLGGVAALLFVLLRNFEESQISVSLAAELTSYYWHFMDGLWIFLFALLYLGK